MAATQIIAPTTAAGTSSDVVVSTSARPVTIGVYRTGGGPIRERGGINVYVEDPAEGLQEVRDWKDRPVVLTQAKPTYSLRSPGTYVLKKSVSTTAIGAWQDGSGD